jgi:hypothetical protein
MIKSVYHKIFTSADSFMFSQEWTTVTDSVNCNGSIDMFIIQETKVERLLGSYHTVGTVGRHLGKKIDFYKLPSKIQQIICNNFSQNFTERH